MKFPPILVALGLAGLCVNHAETRAAGDHDDRNALQATAVALHWLGDLAPAAPASVSWGVPWPRGTVSKETELVVRNAGGQSIPTQTWPMAYWPDGSVKWSGMAVAADQILTAPLSAGPGSPVAPANPLVVRQEETSIEISTGPLRCRVARGGADIIESLTIDGREVGRAGHLVVMREDRSAFAANHTLTEEDYQSRIDKVTVEQSGPVRAVVRIEGMHESTRPARAWLPFSLRLYFTAGLNSIRIVHSFVFDGDETKDFIRGLGIAFTVPFREEKQNRHVRFATDGDGFWAEPVLMSPGYREVLVKNAFRMNEDQLAGKRIPNLADLGAVTKAQFETIALWDSFKLSQLSPDSFSVDKRTGEASSWLHAMNGHRARGFVFLGDVSGGLAVGVKHFWEKYPAALEVNGATGDAGELKVWFWSPDAPAMDLRRYDVIGHDGKISYEDFQEGFGTPYGVANTSELTLWALPNTPSDTELSALAATAAEPPLLVCAPEYYHAVPVFETWAMTDRSTPDKAALEDQLDRAWHFYAHEVEQRRWYGFWDYGDFMRTYSDMRHGWLYDIGGHAWNNTELMADAWLWYTFLRNGRADAFRLAEAMTRNTSEVDVYHLGRFAGIGSRHNVSHWGCGAKELRISEAFLKRFYYYLTTDERTGDLMREVLTADQSLPNALPLRKGFPRPDVPIFVRSGPDWIALAGNWITEWERTGDARYRDYALAGMKSIGAMPEVFAKRLGLGFDLQTKKLFDVGEPNLKTYEFLVLFGGDEIAQQLMESVNCPEFNAAWNALMGQWARDPHSAGITKPRILGYAARESHDASLAATAWNLVRQSGSLPDGQPRFPQTPKRVSVAESAEPWEEMPHVDTPGTAQWALNIISTMEYLREFDAEPTAK